MLDKFTNTLLAVGKLCEILQRNQDGARFLLALSAIALMAYAIHVVAGMAQG
jgi:hypothetical protein